MGLMTESSLEDHSRDDESYRGWTDGTAVLGVPLDSPPQTDGLSLHSSFCPQISPLLSLLVCLFVLRAMLILTGEGGTGQTQSNPMTNIN